MNRIREIRAEKRMTLESLAAIVGITIPHLSRLERGQRPLTDTWMTRIAKGLGVAPAALLQNASQMHPPERGEFISEPEELAMVYAWRDMSEEQRAIMRRLSGGARGKTDNVA